MRITPEICEGCYSYSEYGFDMRYGRTEAGERIEGCALLGSLKYARPTFRQENVPEYCGRLELHAAAATLREL